jgi:class 3 adenylate cyclase
MTTSDEIFEKVSEYLSGDYEIIHVDSIPSVEDVEFGKKAKKIDLCALSIDLRNSTELLTSHQKQTAGKIHKSFLYATTSIIHNQKGFIRSFNGDSVLAFWPAKYKRDIQNCVQTAMMIKWVLAEKLLNLFEKYEKFDFGIGVDWGSVYIIKAGLPRNPNNNDLVFLGECVNYAVTISEQARGPYHVEISEKTYINLSDDLKYGTQDGTQVEIWKNGVVDWKGKKLTSKITTWQCFF